MLVAGTTRALLFAGLSEHRDRRPIDAIASARRRRGRAAAESGDLGRHDAEVYGGWLGLSATEIQALKETGAI
jgi:hypothetical protein